MNVTAQVLQTSISVSYSDVIVALLCQKDVLRRLVTHRGGRWWWRRYHGD